MLFKMQPPLLFYSVTTVKNFCYYRLYVFQAIKEMQSFRVTVISLSQGRILLFFQCVYDSLCQHTADKKRRGNPSPFVNIVHARESKHNAGEGGFL